MKIRPLTPDEKLLLAISSTLQSLVLAGLAGLACAATVALTWADQAAESAAKRRDSGTS